MVQTLVKTKTIMEFGDFQTPTHLAECVTEKLFALGIRPSTILEPTCGKGAFVVAADRTFSEAKAIVGLDINTAYIEDVAAAISHHSLRRVHLQVGDFFQIAWPEVIKAHPGPWLILGNPPWVTSASLGALSSRNLPMKSNFHGRAGIEAVTGKSNFDISEWMLLRYLDWLQGSGTIAVLVKTAVARKILAHVWRQPGVLFSHIYKIDAKESFGVAVDACLFILSLSPEGSSTTCELYDALTDTAPASILGTCKGHLVADSSSAPLEELWGPEKHYAWRSGIKHDCARVMELFCEKDGYTNGLGERVAIEETFLYPLLKGSDIGNGRLTLRAKMIVPQQSVGQPTHGIASVAPDTWAYLIRHQSLLNKRGSVIYRNKPLFSIFGVGPYSFTPWKVAVSSFYKKLMFVAVGPIDNRTVVFDDTVYFLSCGTEEEANFLEEILHSDMATRFFNALVHWSDKRPLTVDILRCLSLEKLAAALGRSADYELFKKASTSEAQQQAFLFAG